VVFKRKKRNILTIYNLLKISVALNENATYWLAGSDIGQKTKFRWCNSEANETFKPFIPFAPGEPDNGAEKTISSNDYYYRGSSAEDILGLTFKGGNLNLHDISSGPSFEFICQEFGEQV